MPYFVTWLKGEQVIAQQAFDDLMAAHHYLFEHRAEYKAQGATAGRVWDDQETYCQIE